MPCTDPRDVTCLADAFDLSTTELRQWELELIWKAIDLRLLRFSPHAERAAADEAIPEQAVWRVIWDGAAQSKDLASGNRKTGINFEGKIRRARWIRAKVSWLVRYVIVTVHTV